ncbi:hypothetical protein BKA69DRAFT_628065 [Paraphysoderma sedebokerense]|nr:hypothetical protein BKA69DRAFT_628065 [Paraphysoderma sedebokerense]
MLQDKSQNPSKRSRKSSQLTKDTNSSATSNSNSITSSVPPALSAAGAASFPYLSQYSYPGFPFPLPFLSFPGLFNIDLSNHMAGDATLNSVPSNPVNGKKKSAKSGKHLPELDEYEEFTGTLEGDDDDEILRLFDIVDVEVFGSTESEEEYLHRQHQNEFEEDTLDEESEDGYSSRRDGRRRSRRLSQGKRNRTLSNLSSVSSNGNGSRQKRLSSSRSNSASRYPSNPSHSGNETVSESQGSDNDRDSDCFSNSSTPRDMNYFGSSASESENDNDEKEKHGSKRSVGKRSAAILANRKIMAHAHTQQDQKVKAVGGPTWVVKDQNPELDQKHVRIGRSSVVQKRPVSDGDTELEDNDEHSDCSQEPTEESRKRKIGRVEPALSVRRRKVSQGRWVEEDLVEHNGSNSNSRSRSRSRSRKYSIPRQQMKSNSVSSSNSNSAPSRDPSLPFTSPKISRHLRALNRWSKIPIGTFRRSRRLSNPCPSVTQAVRTFGGVAVNTDVMIGGGNDGYDDNSDDSENEDKFDNGFGEWDELALGISKLDGPESESNHKREFTSPELTELHTMEITDDYTDFLDLFNIKSSNTQSALPSNSLSISHITQNPTPVSTPSPSVVPGRKPLASNIDNIYPSCHIPLSLPLSLPSSSLSLGIHDNMSSGNGEVGYGVSLDKNLFEDLSLGTSFNIESEGYGMDDINLDLELDFEDEDVGSTTVDRWADNWGWNVEVKREA